MLQEASPLALRKALTASGFAPRFRVAETSAEAVDAARNLGVPVIVHPAERYITAGTRLVEHVEDVPLAFSVARRAGADAVLIESFCLGPRYYVRGGMAGGMEIVGRVPSEPPYCFDSCIYAPAGVQDEVRSELVAAARVACRTVQWDGGAFCADIVMSEEGPVVLGFHGSDLLASWLGDSAHDSGGMAVAWLCPRVGVVTDVTGIQEARDVSGVAAVHVGVQPGDVMGHPADEETRNRAGYVQASAETGEAALAVARRACACIRIETRPII